MIILAILSTSLIHFSFKGWENVRFEFGSERVEMHNEKLICPAGGVRGGVRDSPSEK